MPPKPTSKKEAAKIAAALKADAREQQRARVLDLHRKGKSLGQIKAVEGLSRV